MIALKRIYAPPDPADGYRVLVDRLWPRGLRRENAAIAAWLKELAPSNELRRWFQHEEARWQEFRTRYLAELAAPDKAAQLEDLRQRAKSGTVTLLYAARNETENNAIVLREVLLGKPDR